MRKFLAVAALGTIVECSCFGMLNGTCSNSTCIPADAGRMVCNVFMPREAQSFSCIFLDDIIAQCCASSGGNNTLVRISTVMEYVGGGATVVSLARAVVKYCFPTPEWKIFTMSRAQCFLSSGWLSFVAALPSLGCFVAGFLRMLELMSHSPAT